MIARAAVLAVVLTLVLGACAQPTPAPEPTATPEATEVDQVAITAATRAARPTTTPRPASTRPPPTAEPRMVPADADEFAQYVIANYSQLDGVDLAPNGEYLWLPNQPNVLFVYLDKSMFGLELSDVDNVTKQEWITPLVQDMETFANGEDWSVSFSHSRIETNPIAAGEDKVTWEGWLYVSDDYDADAGGFQVTETPVYASKMGKSVFIKMFPLDYRRGIDSFMSR